MLGGKFFNKAKTFNPTDLPEYVISTYCNISHFKHYGNGFTISDPGSYDDYVMYDKYVRSINLQPPPVKEVFEAAKRNRLRLLIKESVDPDRKLPISLKPDQDALTKSFEFESKHKPTKEAVRGRKDYVFFKRQNSGMKYGYEFY